MRERRPPQRQITLVCQRLSDVGEQEQKRSQTAGRDYREARELFHHKQPSGSGDPWAFPRTEIPASSNRRNHDAGRAASRVPLSYRRNGLTEYGGPSFYAQRAALLRTVVEGWLMGAVA